MNNNTINNLINEMIGNYNHTEYKLVIEKCNNLLNYHEIPEKLSYKIKELMAYSYLALGNFQKGWKYWKFRESAIKTVNEISQICNLLFWHGNKFKKNLIIKVDEDFEEEIYYHLFFHLLINYADQVYIECDKRLIDTYISTFPEITFFERNNINKFIEYGRKCLYYGLLGDLPYYLNPQLVPMNSRQLRLKNEEIKEVFNYKFMYESYFWKLHIIKRFKNTILLGY